MWVWANNHPELLCIIVVTILLCVYAYVQALMGFVEFRFGRTFPGRRQKRVIEVMPPVDDSVDAWNAFVDRFNAEVEKCRLEKRIKE